MTEAVSESASRTVSIGYTAGQVTSLTDAAGKVWQFQRNGLGNLDATMSPMKELATYAYDPLGRMTSITNELGKITALAYDASGQLAHVQRPDDTALDLTYDDAGRLVKMVDPLKRATRRSLTRPAGREPLRMGCRAIARGADPKAQRSEGKRLDRGR